MSNLKEIIDIEKQIRNKQFKKINYIKFDEINYYNFINNLSYFRMMLLLPIITDSYECSINYSVINNINYLYLKNYLLYCNKIKQFFKYYASIPIDLKEDKYFESIIYHYRFLYNFNQHLQY